MILGLLSMAESMTYLLGAITATNQATRVAFNTNRAVLRVFVIGKSALFSPITKKNTNSVGQLYALLGENELVPELIGYVLITVLIWDTGTTICMPLLVRNTRIEDFVSHNDIIPASCAANAYRRSSLAHARHPVDDVHSPSCVATEQ